MAFRADVNGSLTPHESLSDDEKGKAKRFLENLFAYSGIEITGDTQNIEVSGYGSYHMDDWNEAAKYYDGTLNFVGDENTQWRLNLENGKMQEISPVEVWAEKPGQSETDMLLSALRKKSDQLNPLDVLQKVFPDYIAAKVWTREDIRTAAEDMMELPENAVNAIDFDKVVEEINSPAGAVLTEATDEEWDVLKRAVQHDLEENEVKKEEKGRDEQQENTRKHKGMHR